MKKEITVYFTPVKIEIELDDNLDEREVEEEINRQVYDTQIDYIINETCIDCWEE